MINHTLKKNTSREAVRYIIVGLANTAMTAVVIFGLMHAGVGIYPSNATGYVVGIIFSFVMNAKFTFSTTLSPLRFYQIRINMRLLLHFKFNSNESFFHRYT